MNNPSEYDNGFDAGYELGLNSETPLHKFSKSIEANSEYDEGLLLGYEIAQRDQERERLYEMEIIFGERELERELDINDNER